MAKRSLCVLLALMTVFSLTVPAFAEAEPVAEAAAGENVGTDEPVVMEEHADPRAAAKPGTPKLDKVTNTAGGVKITWKAASGAARYRVYYKTSGGGWKKAGDTKSTSYTWTKAKSGTKYTFTVKAFNSEGKAGKYDTTGKSVTYVAAPAAKVSLTADGIQISWNKCAGAGAYRVFWKDSADGSWKKIGDTVKTSYTHPNKKLASGTTYWFTVRCVKAKGSKTYLSAYDTAGASVRYVKAPTVKASVTDDGIRISWDACEGAGAYRVFWKASANGGWKKIGDTVKTSYTHPDSKLTGGTTYWFTVRCVKEKGSKTYVSSYDDAGKSVTYPDPEVPDVPDIPDIPDVPDVPDVPDDYGGTGWTGVPEDPNGADYVLNTNTMKFHRPGCSAVSRMSAANREDVKALRSAVIAAGYEPCQICNP